MSAPHLGLVPTLTSVEGVEATTAWGLPPDRPVSILTMILLERSVVDCLGTFGESLPSPSDPHPLSYEDGNTSWIQ